MGETLTGKAQALSLLIPQTIILRFPKVALCISAHPTPTTSRVLSSRPVLCAWPSSLYLGIVHVVGMSSQEQMIGVDASSIVAFMKNAHAFRYLSVRLNPGSSMRQLLLSTKPSVAVSAIVNPMWPHYAVAHYVIRSGLI